MVVFTKNCFVVRVVVVQTWKCSSLILTPLMPIGWGLLYQKKSSTTCLATFTVDVLIYTPCMLNDVFNAFMRHIKRRFMFHHSESLKLLNFKAPCKPTYLAPSYNDRGWRPKCSCMESSRLIPVGRACKTGFFLIHIVFNIFKDRPRVLLTFVRFKRKLWAPCLDFTLNSQMLRMMLDN